MSSSWLPTPPRDFAVSIGRDGATLRIAITGELDLATGPDLVTAVLGAEPVEEAPDDMIIDLARLDFVDPAGLRALVQVTAGRRAQFINLSSSTRRLFDITGLADSMDID